MDNWIYLIFSDEYIDFFEKSWFNFYIPLILYLESNQSIIK